VRLRHSGGVRRHDVLMPLADELGNMRTAWDEWAARGDVARLNDMLAPMWGYYDARGDYRSAIELGWKLLDCLADMPDSPERRRDEFAVRMSVARTELALQGYTAEAERMIREAVERAEALGDDRQRFPGLRSLGHMHIMRTDFESTAVVADEIMAIAEEERDPMLLAEAHIMAGMSVSWHVGFEPALEHYAQAVAHAEAMPRGQVDFRVGPHPAVVANGVTALTQWFVGLPETAAASMARALELAEELEHPYSLAYVLHHASLLDLWRGDLGAVRDRTAELRALAELHDYPMWRALGLILGGAAEVGCGRVDSGIAQVDEGFALYRGLSTPPVFWPALLMIHATALLGAGRVGQAMAMMDEAETVLQDGDPVIVDFLILRGDLLMAGSPADPAAAIDRYEQAVAVARPRSARAGLLRALTRLVAVRRGTPQEAAAREALQEVYDGLTEGRDLPHLLEASALLDPG
jgi:tetratricopeptide (TPR) repeat protein